MSQNLRKLGYNLALIVAFMVVFEGVAIVRWMFFNGHAPSLHDLETGLGILILIWAATKIGGWFERREARDKEVAARIRDIDTRVEALYRWGSVSSSSDGETDNDDWEWELEDESKAAIAECREGMRRGDTTSRSNLGVIFWNHAMTHYNAHSTDGYREAIRWLRKAASVDYDCESTLGDAYTKLEDFDEAMRWYRRSLRRGGSLSWIAESNIAEMYAKGKGVSQNLVEAAWWWNKAAQHGSDWSHYELGKLYFEGADGVQQDRRKAYFHLYIASSANGNYSPQKSAVELRDKVARELGEYFVGQERERAEQWLAVKKEMARERSRSRVKPLPLPD